MPSADGTAQLPATVELAPISGLTPAIILCHKTRVVEICYRVRRQLCGGQSYSGHWLLELSLTGWVGFCWLCMVHVCVYSNVLVPSLECQCCWQLLPEFHEKIFGKSHADMFILLAVRMSKCESWMLSFSLNGAIATTHEIWQNKYIFTHDFCQTHIIPLFSCCPKWL